MDAGTATTRVHTFGKDWDLASTECEAGLHVLLLASSSSGRDVTYRVVNPCVLGYLSSYDVASGFCICPSVSQLLFAHSTNLQ